MSQAVFPTLPGLQWSIGRAPGFNNKVQRAVSGKELRAAFMQYPLWTFRLSYEFLCAGNAGTELDTLAGFFLARRGSFDSFLFTDNADCSVTDMSFGAGNGSQTQFQLTRAYGAGGFTFTEPVQNVNTLTNVKVAGVTKTPTTDYTVSSTGMVTFTSAPANGAALTFTGTYYFRVRFLQDVADFEQFLKDLWQLKKLEFVGAPGNKV